MLSNLPKDLIAAAANIVKVAKEKGLKKTQKEHQESFNNSTFKPATVKPTKSNKK